MLGPARTSPHALSLTFHGAAQSVTGSMHLVEAAGARVLLDCGLVLGRHPDTRQRNRLFPFDPAGLDAVVLSHAHVDHCGNLPNLVGQGFGGPIFCTAATRRLLGIMLADSARIQAEEARIDEILGRADECSTGQLYSSGEVERTLAQCVTLPYGRPHDIRPGLALTLHDAGHLLGSAMVHLASAGASLLFTGDLGRSDLRFLKAPEALPAADMVVCESTYGGRRHPPVEKLRETLRKVVRRTIDREGKVLVPAFSLGRAQIVVHYLRQWMRDGALPAAPIFVDSALAADIAEAYALHPESLAVLPDANGSHAPRYVRAAAESRDLSRRRGPAIIVASGGMCEAGRILNHFEHGLDDPRNSVVLVSYQAPGSLGRSLLERGPSVRFRGKRWNKWAEVVDLSGFSAHADHDGLLNALAPLLPNDPRICLVHGDIENATLLARDLEDLGFWHVDIPRREQTVSLTARM
ncbi:MAG: MBL fold metallo-hydrolase [Gemmataceae bacterium]|mgnify:CR=1 FL=1